MGFDTIEINLVKTYFANYFLFRPTIETEMELSKQEIELFLLLPEHQSKNFFYKMFLTFNNKLDRGYSGVFNPFLTCLWGTPRAM